MLLTKVNTPNEGKEKVLNMKKIKKLQKGLNCLFLAFHCSSLVDDVGISFTGHYTSYKQWHTAQWDVEEEEWGADVIEREEEDANAKILSCKTHSKSCIGLFYFLK